MHYFNTLINVCPGLFYAGDPNVLHFINRKANKIDNEVNLISKPSIQYCFACSIPAVSSTRHGNLYVALTFMISSSKCKYNESSILFNYNYSYNNQTCMPIAIIFNVIIVIIMYGVSDSSTSISIRKNKSYFPRLPRLLIQ